jgi:Uma2 family endonuclease
MASITADIARAVTPPPGVPGRPHRWTRQEYMRLGEAGGFDTKVELLEGVIVDKWSEGETLEERRHRWTREEYERIAENGGFGELRVELIYGEVLEKMSPQGSRHATAMRAVQEYLRSAYADGFDVRAQLPLAPDAVDASVPEPDLAVVPGTFRDYRDRHPTSAILVVEIADASLRTDKRLKARVYAEAGIPEYWIVNLIDDVVEVHREPAGDTYARIQAFSLDEEIAPLTRPDASVPVSALLP